MKLLSLVLTVLTSLPALAVDKVQFALPDRAQYTMTLNLSQDSKMGQRRKTRSAQMTARVEIEKIVSGHRLSITYLTHYETVSGTPAAGDLRGLKVVYEMNSIGKVTQAEGIEQVVTRLTASMALPPALAGKSIAAQKKVLSEQCELIASSLFGKPTTPGMQWKELQMVQGLGLKPKPVTRELKSIGSQSCGLGECFAVEGTYQFNSSDEVARALESAIEASGKQLLHNTHVDSSWDSARFQILVHAETGLVAGYREHVVGSTIVRNGTRSAKEERSRRIEFSLRSESLEAPPIKARVVVP